VKYAFIEAKEVAFPFQAMCQALNVSRSGYYAWKERPAVDADTIVLSAEIVAAHKRSRGTYGSPRIHRELRARGIRTSRKRVERLMREKRLKGAQKRRFHCTTDSRHSLPIAPNTLNRNFDPSEADRIWAGDVSVPQISNVGDEGRSLAIGLQEQVANPHKRLGSKAPVVSVVEKVS
jgi:putative transposase